MEQKILFTRQRHDADRAGLHWDYRIVIGDKAYSWATKKEMPEPGKSIILWEQPVHTADYALRKRIVIPKGQYGSGTTTLDYVKKGTIKSEPDKHVITIDGTKERLLLKKLDYSQRGDAWLFKNLGVKEESLEKKSEFKPDLTPEEMAQLGVLVGKYTEGNPKEGNFFKVDASMKSWPETWHNNQHPLGWYQWYQNYSKGIRTDDDERQMKRWESFKARHMAQLAKADPTLVDLSVQPRRRQALLNWGIAPGDKSLYFSKQASAPEKKPKSLQPHQERALKKLDELDQGEGIILDHSTGSGKTLTFMKAVERLHKKDPNSKALLIAPASLVSNVDKEIAKHNLKINRDNFTAMSYEKAVNRTEDLAKNHYGLVIADEAHKLRSTGTKRHSNLSELIQGADKKILATATTTYNHASDIAPLINLAAGEKELPEGKKEFEKEFIGKEIQRPPILKRLFGAHPVEVSSLKHKQYLKKILNRYVDHYDLRKDPKAVSKFPSKEEQIVNVEMSKDQERVYKYLEDALPFHLKFKVRMNMPLDKKESASLNAFSTGIRQASNSVRPFSEKKPELTPKIRQATDHLHKMYSEDKNFRGVVYSNFLAGGLADYSDELNSKNIPHTVYHGGLSSKEKDQAVEDYNSGKRPVLLVSSSGAEGLNLKGTKLIQTLEPHFNKSKIDQVVGRGIRYESHEHLPAEERKVLVQHYHSVFPPGLFGKSKATSIDKYLYHHSANKDELSSELKELIDGSSNSKSRK